jgi:hypothetical protein
MIIAVTLRPLVMSFEKAQQLLELATFVVARRLGVTPDEVGERFGISGRTAQRIMHALEAHFRTPNQVSMKKVVNASGFKPERYAICLRSPPTNLRP